MQISQPMKDIKTAYVKLKKEWRNLLPHERLALFHVMTASWTILHNSTQALCEVSGYPFEKRLEAAQERIVSKYRGYVKRLKELDAQGKRQGGSSLGEAIDNYQRGYTLEKTMTLVGQAESEAWGQWLTELKTRPHDDRVMRARDGKLHKYRWDMTFSNPAVRDRFFQTLFDELRKARLKMDQISSLAYAIGSWRSGGETEKQTLRPKGGGPSQL